MEEYEEEYEEYEEYAEAVGGGAVNKILIAVIAVLVVAVGVVGFMLIKNMRSKETNIGLALTQEELDSAMDAAAANAKAGNIALRYKNSALSADGESFTCFIMNSKFNAYDMFLTIYGDEEMTDELFSSGLVAPGRGFDQLKLNHSLPQGQNTVYVVLSQVETDEDGVQSIVGQTSHTMQFVVQ